MNPAISNILEQLNERDITKTQLAQKSGLALGTISRILNGKQELKADTLKRIADALGVSTYEIEDSEADSNSRFKVAGYLDYCGEIVRIKTLKDLKAQVAKIESLESAKERTDITIWKPFSSRTARSPTRWKSFPQTPSARRRHPCLPATDRNRSPRPSRPTGSS